MYRELYGLGIIYPVFILLSLLWILAIVHIWHDADELYGTGWFWMFCVLIVPLIAIPSYWLMKLGTHRSWKEELAAQESKERKRNMCQRCSGQVRHIQQRLSGGTCSDEYHGCEEVEKRVRFRPFRHTFAASAELLRQRIEAVIEPDNGNGVVTGGTDGMLARAKSTPACETSSQGCGDRLRDHRLNERMSWRKCREEVRSRWTPTRRGGGVVAATREELPF